MKVKKTAAMFIRILSAPPIMVTALVLILTYGRDDIFLTTAQTVLSIIFLGILPVLAYPISLLVPALRRKGRDGQRNLAFYLSAAGYAAAWIFGLCSQYQDQIMIIYTTYLFSVATLLLLNKVFRIRASGHACSITGPVIFCCYFFGGISILIGIVVYGIIFWASIAAKRHTPRELLFGTLACILAFAASLLIY